jgi:hypothetical protein
LRSGIARVYTLSMTTTNETRGAATTTTIRSNHYAKGGRLVAGNIESASRDEARYFAARWNRTEERPEMRIEIVRFGDGFVSAIY